MNEERAWARWECNGDGLVAADENGMEVCMSDSFGCDVSQASFFNLTLFHFQFLHLDLTSLLLDVPSALLSSDATSLLKPLTSSLDMC